MKKKIGPVAVIGLGIMGGAISANLVKAGILKKHNDFVE